MSVGEKSNDILEVPPRFELGNGGFAGLNTCANAQDRACDYAEMGPTRSVANTEESAAGVLKVSGACRPVQTAGRRAPSLYMVQSGGPSGPVKIGYATNVLYRVSNLQTGNPERLTLILEARVPDPAALEAELHDRFRAHRIRGEWFRYHQDVAAARAELQRFSPAMLMAELLRGAV